MLLFVFWAPASFLNRWIQSLITTLTERLFPVRKGGGVVARSGLKMLDGDEGCPIRRKVRRLQTVTVMRPRNELLIVIPEVVEESEKSMQTGKLICSYSIECFCDFPRL